MTTDFEAGVVVGKTEAYKDVIDWFAKDGVRPIEIIEHIAQRFRDLAVKYREINQTLTKEFEGLEREAEGRKLSIDLVNQHHQIAGHVRGLKELVDTCDLSEETQRFIQERMEQLANKAQELYAMARIALGG